MPARLTIWPSLLRRRNCCTPSRGAPSVTGCCAKTPSLRARAGEVCCLEQIVGECAQNARIAPADPDRGADRRAVLVLGESGTGKELAAGALHQPEPSPRCQLTSGSIAPRFPKPCLESELFGHEKGAFTGALKQKPGRVRKPMAARFFWMKLPT